MLRKIINWLDEYYSKDDIKRLEAKQKELTEKTNQINNLSTEIQKAKDDLANSKLLLKKLEDDNKKISELLDYQLPIPSDVNERINHYDTKYPQAYLTYAGRPIKMKSSSYTPDVYLPDYIFTFASLKNYLSEKGLTFPDYYIKYNKDYIKALDALREDIYNEVIAMRRYKFDSDLFGSVENWSGPWISFYLKINNKRYMDCEDSSLLLMSLFLSAGIPRGLQRAVCGMTSLGGHCIVAVYSMEKQKWLHYETTAQVPTIYDLDDETNPLCVTNTWFSFDWKYAWSNNPQLIDDFFVKKQ